MGAGKPDNWIDWNQNGFINSTIVDMPHRLALIKVIHFINNLKLDSILCHRMDSFYSVPFLCIPNEILSCQSCKCIFNQRTAFFAIKYWNRHFHISFSAYPTVIRVKITIIVRVLPIWLLNSFWTYLDRKWKLFDNKCQLTEWKARNFRISFEFPENCQRCIRSLPRIRLFMLGINKQPLKLQVHNQMITMKKWWTRLKCFN